MQLLQHFPRNEQKLREKKNKYGGSVAIAMQLGCHGWMSYPIKIPFWRITSKKKKCETFYSISLTAL